MTTTIKNQSVCEDSMRYILLQSSVEPVVLSGISGQTNAH